MIGDDVEQTGDAPPADGDGRAQGRRRGRPAKPSRRNAELRGTVVKKYTLTREEERTAGHIRRIIMQREVPDTARVAFDDNALTIEWTCE